MTAKPSLTLANETIKGITYTNAVFSSDVSPTLRITVEVFLTAIRSQFVQGRQTPEAVAQRIALRLPYVQALLDYVNVDERTMMELLK